MVPSRTINPESTLSEARDTLAGAPHDSTVQHKGSRLKTRPIGRLDQGRRAGGDSQICEERRTIL
jgi:hypothetical protein